jgi:hypothetical protein
MASKRQFLLDHLEKVAFIDDKVTIHGSVVMISHLSSAASASQMGRFETKWLSRPVVRTPIGAASRPVDGDRSCRSARRRQPAGCVGQGQRVIQFAVSQHPGIRGDARTAKSQHQPAVEIEP